MWVGLKIMFWPHFIWNGLHHLLIVYASRFVVYTQSHGEVIAVIFCITQYSYQLVLHF